MHFVAEIKIYQSKRVLLPNDNQFKVDTIGIRESRVGIFLQAVGNVQRRAILKVPQDRNLPLFPSNISYKLIYSNNFF